MQTILNTFEICVSPTQLYNCTHCWYYSDTEHGFDILWSSSIKNVLCLYNAVYYILPLKSSATLQEVFNVLGLSDAIVEIGWFYHLQDTNTILSTSIHDITLVSILLYKDNETKLKFTADK